MTLLALLLSAQPAAATQYSPPYADIFGNHWDNLDTSGASTRLYQQLAGTGYARFNNLSASARQAMGAVYAQADAIWVDFGHGTAGTIQFCHTPICTSEQTSWLFANPAMGTCGQADSTCLSDYNGGSLDDIRLMIFAGCLTGLDGAPGTIRDGNLVDVAQLRDGVDSAFGWRVNTYFPMGEDYASFLGIELANGSTVDYAVWKAGQEVKNRWGGNDFGWLSTYGRWRTNATIIPASYGITGWP